MKLHLIDFDGTITKKDSFFEFIKFCTPTYKFYLTATIPVGIFFFHKLGLYKALKAKEFIMSFYFYGKTKQELETNATAFIEHLYKIKDFKEELLLLIQEQKKLSNRVIIVSASLDLWLIPFCKKYDIDLIATKIAYSGNLFKGKFSSPNCNGEEKATRIKSEINLSQYNEIEVYGNSKGDIPMMKLGTKNHWY